MMYNYLKEMKKDIVAFLDDEFERCFSQAESVEEFKDELNEILWTNDSITGNASGSYTFSSYQAQLYVTENLDLLRETVATFDTPAEEVGKRFLDGDWEWFDVSIRCYLLPQAIEEVVEERRNDFEKWFANEE